MAYLYRRHTTHYVDAGGKRCKKSTPGAVKRQAASKTWWGAYRDEHGARQRLALAPDKCAAQMMLNELARKAALVKAGLVSPFEKHHKRPLSEHVADYFAQLEDKGNSDGYIRNRRCQLTALVAGCKFRRIGEIQPDRVLRFLAELRASGRSVGTSNEYLQAVKSFTRWLLHDRRTGEDRLIGLKKQNPDIDRRRERRPLTEDEFAKLLAAAESGPVFRAQRGHGKISGSDRVLVYLIAAYTGLRAKEIGSLTRSSFKLDTVPSVVHVRAAASKHRRHDTIELNHELADRLRDWLAERADVPVDARVLPISSAWSADMIRADLERAEIPYVDHDGLYADFHALRGTFSTNLARAGVSLQMAQGLMRHSDPKLTMKVYTKLGLHDRAAAVDSLPPIPGVGRPVPQPEAISATGTDGPGGDTTVDSVRLPPLGGRHFVCSAVRQNDRRRRHRSAEIVLQPTHTGTDKATSQLVSPSTHDGTDWSESKAVQVVGDGTDIHFCKKMRVRETFRPNIGLR